MADKKAATKVAEAAPVVKNVAKKGKALALEEFKSVFLAHPYAEDFICVCSCFSSLFFSITN